MQTNMVKINQTWVKKVASSCLKFFLWSLCQNTLIYVLFRTPKIKLCQKEALTLLQWEGAIICSMPTPPAPPFSHTRVLFWGEPCHWLYITLNLRICKAHFFYLNRNNWSSYHSKVGVYNTFFVFCLYFTFNCLWCTQQSQHQRPDW